MRSFGLDAGAAEKVGAEGTGLDDGDMDAERSEFRGERLREAFDGELAGVVVAPAGQADEAADGGEIDDVAAALLAEVRQKRTSDAHQAEDIGLEHGHELVFGDLFDRARETIARVVDEHIDRTEAGDGLGDDRVNLRGVGDIECERFGLAGILLFEVGNLVELARGGDDLAAGLEDLFGEDATEAGRGSGDEPGAGCSDICHVFEMLLRGFRLDALRRFRRADVKIGSVTKRASFPPPRACTAFRWP